MTTYVVESYLSKSRAVELETMAARARAAAEELTREGTQVSYVRSVFVPDDEVCFHFFEAPDLVAAKEVCRRGLLDCDRIAPATSTGISLDREEEPHRTAGGVT